MIEILTRSKYTSRMLPADTNTSDPDCDNNIDDDNNSGKDHNKSSRENAVFDMDTILISYCFQELNFK